MSKCDEKEGCEFDATCFNFANCEPLKEGAMAELRVDGYYEFICYFCGSRFEVNDNQDMTRVTRHGQRCPRSQGKAIFEVKEHNE